MTRRRDDPADCPACGAPFIGHWQCVLCRCFGHKNVIAKDDRKICTSCAGSLAKRGLKRCWGCNTLHPIESYRPRVPRCAACLKARRRVKYEKNKARELTNWQAYYREHRDRLNEARKQPARRAQRQAYARVYYRRHAEKIKAQRKAQYWRYRARRLESARQWRARNRDLCRNYIRVRRARQLLRLLKGAA